MRIYQRVKEPASGMAIHPIVRWIWREINRQRASQEDVASRAGVSSSAMRKWRRGANAPKLADVEAVVNVLGGELRVRYRQDDK